MNVLDDHVLVAVGNTETLSADNTLAANTDDTLVRADINRLFRSIVIFAIDPCAIITLILDPSLTLRGTALTGSGLGAAALALGGTLSTEEVPLTVNQDNTGNIVR